MNSIVNITATGSTGYLATTPVVSVMSASRGILAVQGIRLSGRSGDLGLQGFATKTQAAQTIVMKQDKPSGGWHPVVAAAAPGMHAVESGINPANLRPARLRDIHLATVIRSRHRSRLG
ncbi:MAG: hypothetical protein JWN03_1829 [Nocardia sp.]|nr:hypothetical protein [Nocardia sp.]